MREETREYIQHRTSTQQMSIWLYERKEGGERAYLQSRNHLTFFLTIRGVVEVLHRDEWGETVVDSVVCRGCQSTPLRGRGHLLCMAWNWYAQQLSHYNQHAAIDSDKTLT